MSRMMLQGRSAIITGANQGLGQALAHRFVTAGASVLLVARGAERLRQVEDELKPLAGPDQVVTSLPADVSKPESCQAVIDRAWEVLPSLTILVNNAGIYGPMGPV